MKEVNILIILMISRRKKKNVSQINIWDMP